MKVSMANKTQSFQRVVRILKRYGISLLIFCAFIAIAVVAVLMDMGFIVPPAIFVQRTGDNTIYRNLFAAQASMIGVVMAIMALLSRSIDTRAYGLSLTKYIMHLKPFVIFRHGSVFIQLIVITAASWVSVAMNYNNLTVALFAYTIALLLYLSTGIIKLISSGDLIKGEVKDFLLGNNDIVYVMGLLREIEESIANGNVALFKQDYGFALEKIYVMPFSSYQAEDIEKLESLFLAIIRSTREERFARAIDILDLYIHFMEAVNKEKSNVKLTKLVGYEAYMLLSETNLEKIQERSLLYRWQRADFDNDCRMEKPTYHYGATSITSSLYYHINKNESLSSAKKDEIFIDLLADAQYLIKNGDESTGLAECYYVNYVVRLFRGNEFSVLAALMEGRGKLSDIIFNRRYSRRGNEFVHTRANVFVVLYMYYLSYRTEHVSADYMTKCKNLLDSIAVSFWDGVVVRHRNGNQQELSITYHDYIWFSKLLNQYEVNHPPDEDGIIMKVSLYDTICLDFCVFYLTRTTSTIQELEDKLIAMFICSDDEHSRDMFVLFRAYFEQESSSHSRYTEFCSVFRPTYAIPEENIKDGYERLKTASMNLYRKQRLHKAAVEGCAFTDAQTQHEQVLKKAFKQVIGEFSSQFADFDDGDEVEFQDFSSKEGSPIGYIESHHINDIEQYKRSISVKLQQLLVNQLLNANVLSLETTTRSNGTALMFLKQIDDMDVDLLLGFNSFRYDDPNYADYDDKVNGLKRLENIGAIHASILSSLIKMSVRSAELRIVSADESTKRRWYEDGDSMVINKIPVPLTEEEHSEYVDNNIRVIDIKFELALSYSSHVIGGGLRYE